MDNGKENGNHRDYIGVIRDNGKERGATTFRV